MAYHTITLTTNYSNFEEFSKLESAYKAYFEQHGIDLHKNEGTSVYLIKHTAVIVSRDACEDPILDEGKLIFGLASNNKQSLDNVVKNLEKMIPNLKTRKTVSKDGTRGCATINLA